VSQIIKELSPVFCFLLRLFRGGEILEVLDTASFEPNDSASCPLCLDNPFKLLKKARVPLERRRGREILPSSPLQYSKNIIEFCEILFSNLGNLVFLRNEEERKKGNTRYRSAD